MRSSAFALAALLLVFPLQAAAKDKSFSRADVTKIIAQFRKVVSTNGVEEQLEIPVGGTKQWITVRGRDRRNPILLYIHGGPASPEMPVSWAYQSAWEDYFTVVQWDQRGAGKTYNANDPKVIGPTLSLKRIVADAGEVVQYLRHRYGKKKIFVLGHSWGSVVGLSLAHEHPEWLHAYIGMGQVINGVENERVGFRLTLKAAQEAGNAQAVKDLRSLGNYPDSDGSVTPDKIQLERKWLKFFGGLTWGRKHFNYYSHMERLSPDYTAADVKAIDKGSKLSMPRLLPDIIDFDFSQVTDFKTPIVIFAGRHDYTTPSEIVAAWLKRVTAPSKKLIWFEHSAHMIEVEEPGRMLVHLVQDVRPLARPEVAARGGASAGRR